MADDSSYPRNRTPAANIVIDEQTLNALQQQVNSLLSSYTAMLQQAGVSTGFPTTNISPVSQNPSTTINTNSAVPNSSQQNQQRVLSSNPGPGFMRVAQNPPNHQQRTGFQNDANNQQLMNELSRGRRPSLLSNFPDEFAQSQNNRSSILGQQNSQMADQQPSHSRLSMSSQMFNTVQHNNTVAGSQMEAIELEEEMAKKMLSEGLERIGREQIQAKSLLTNAKKKIAMHQATYNKIMSENKHPDETANDEDDAEEAQSADGEFSTMVDRIYAENRRKAAASKAPFLPLLGECANSNLTRAQAARQNEAIMQETYERGMELLPSLIQAMRIQRDRHQANVEGQQAEYNEILSTWEQKIAKYERNPKKLARDAKNREIFEKTFSELKKMREEKERNNRVERSRFSLSQGENGGNGSGAENSNSNECIESSENVDEKMRAAAIAPPLCTNPPRRFFENRTGLVEDALAELRGRIEQFLGAWTETEKSIFSEKIGFYGKNFAAIAAFLPMKSVRDCVQYYYMSKKRNNYKQKFGRKRKNKPGKPYRPPQMPQFGEFPTDDNHPSNALFLQSLAGKESVVVACLLCDTRIVVLESLGQSSAQFDPFGYNVANCSASNQSIPVCTKCNNLAQKNKTANRCPIGSCGPGKRKMKPVRTVPEKFHGLSVEHKRFIVYRLKIPPMASKCCNNCCKRIIKEVESLLENELCAEFETFKSNQMEAKETRRIGIEFAPPTIALSSLEEEAEEEKPSPLETAQSTTQIAWNGIAGAEAEKAKQKEIKLEVVVKEELKESNVEPMIVADENVLMPSPPVPAQLPRLASAGSITKGTPNRVQPSISPKLDAQVGVTSPTMETLQTKPAIPVTTAPSEQNSPTIPLPFVQLLRESSIFSGDAGAQIDTKALEDIANGLLAHFGINPESKSASAELSEKLMDSPETLLLLQQFGSSMFGAAQSTSTQGQQQGPSSSTFAAMDSLAAKRGQTPKLASPLEKDERELPEQLADKLPEAQRQICHQTEAVGLEDSAGALSESMKRRKTGLATALLPSADVQALPPTGTTPHRLHASSSAASQRSASSPISPTNLKSLSTDQLQQPLIVPSTIASPNLSISIAPSESRDATAPSKPLVLSQASSNVPLVQSDSNPSDEALLRTRSCSAKAYSSSCYESLSEDSDGQEETVVNPSKSQSQRQQLQQAPDNLAEVDEPMDTQAATFYSVLDFGEIDDDSQFEGPTSSSAPPGPSSAASSFHYLAASTPTTPAPKQIKQEFEVKAEGVATNCIYEPLSDDDD